jgi:hypothetical protein
MFTLEETKLAEWLKSTGLEVGRSRVWDPQPPNRNYSREAEAHACNPSYLGGRDQEDGDSKQIGLAEWLKVKALSSIPSTTKKKKKMKKKGLKWII